MRVAELLEALEDMPEDAEIMIAYQPSWPLQVTCSEVVLFPDPHGERECETCGRAAVASAFNDGICPHCGEENDHDEEDEEKEPLVYIVAGSSHHKLSPYAPGVIFGR